MWHEELLEAGRPALEKVKEHPFWAGLRDGSLPGEALVRFFEQDTDHLLPQYARAMGRAVPFAREDRHAALLGRSVFGSMEARDRFRENHTELEAELGLPEAAPAGTTEANPTTHAHTSFFHAAASTSIYAALGALLPMVWFNFNVSNDLLERKLSGSRYSRWIDVYHPGETYGYVVKAFLGMVDEIAEAGSDADRAELTASFLVSTQHEWAFAEAAWVGPEWPV